MKTNLIIIGAGQFGRETLNWASQAIAHGAPWKIKGFLDTRPDELDGFDYDTKILGDAEHYTVKENDVFIGAIGNPAEKLHYYNPILNQEGRFINIIHPKASIGKNVRIGTGNIVAPFASITCDAQVGNHVALLSFSNAGHDTVIGDCCQISSHCGINGEVRIDNKVFLGSHVCIVPQVVVGAGAYVGAGSVVLKNVEPNAKVFGNPALTIGKQAV